MTKLENDLNDLSKYPILKRYQIFKTKYQLEPGLCLVKITNIGWQFLNSGPVHTCTQHIQRKQAVPIL